MSLKVEQRLINEQFTEFEPRIYTTGAYLVPMQVQIDNEVMYVWIVDEFESDTYFDGDSISASVIADNINKLFKK